MTDLVFHPSTKAKLSQFLHHPTHALVIVGTKGLGKHAIGLNLAARLTGQSMKQFDQYPYFKYLSPDKNNISIESIRDLQAFIKLKLPVSTSRRVIVINQADTLTVEAQNAVLKMLEEPTKGTFFILTVNNSQSILPTIRSRSQLLSLQAPVESDLTNYFKTKKYESSKINQAYLMSGGMPGLMSSLLKDDREHPMVSAANQAREFLRADTFNRLIIADVWSKSRDESLKTVTIMQQMASVALKKSTNQSTTKKMQSWSNILKRAFDAENELRNSAQPKLVLTNLALNV